MIYRFFVLSLTVSLVACGSQPVSRDGEQGRFYSYVDAQGNLVTLERPGKPEQGAAGQQTQDEPAGGQGDDGEAYRSAEEVEAELEERRRDRFVTYLGPEGEVIRRPVDLTAEREAREARPAEYREIEADGQFFESLSRVPVDCCAHLLEGAHTVGPGEQRRVRFQPGYHGWLRLDDPRPAVALKLSPGLGWIRVASYIHEDAYLSPHLLFLDREGRPVLKVNNVFTRRYPENWYRFGYFEGRLQPEPEFGYLVLYLPYARKGDGAVVPEPGLEGAVVEGARAALEGELVVSGED